MKFLNAANITIAIFQTHSGEWGSARDVVRSAGRAIYVSRLPVRNRNRVGNESEVILKTRVSC